MIKLFYIKLFYIWIKLTELLFKSLSRWHGSTRPRTLTLFVYVNFTTYFFSRDKMPIDMKMLVFFPRKCVRTAAKTMVVNRKNQTALALLTGRRDRCEILRTQVLCRPSSQQNRQQRLFSPSTKKTTEYSFKLFLSINKIEF